MALKSSTKNTNMWKRAIGIELESEWYKYEEGKGRKKMKDRKWETFEREESIKNKQ